MTADSLVVLGQILGTAFASGLNLYGTVAVLGLASRWGWITDLSPALRGLESPLLIASAVVLFLLEFIADKVPYLDSAWDVVHTFVRPVAAALLVLGLLDTYPLPVRIPGAVLAGAVALGAHGTKAGLRLILNAAPNRLVPALVSLAEDVAAVGLVVLSIEDPTLAMAVVSAFFLIVALFVRRVWRAFVLGVRSLLARLRGFFGTARWHGPDELPRRLRELLDPVPLGQAQPRATRAALTGVKGVGDYRSGWLVMTPDALVFLYRSYFRPRRITLPATRGVRTRSGLWADLLEMETGEGGYALLVMKDGPSADRIATDLSPVLS